MAALPAAARAATITVTITGTTGEIKVGEGPIFGHSSYQKIPPGDPFVLTYTFDDERGKQTISGISGGYHHSIGDRKYGPLFAGTNAVLQIGSAVWEFGASTRSHVTLQTSAAARASSSCSPPRRAATASPLRSFPAKGGYWPKNGDWRSSFTSTSLDGSTASFSADNDRVSASGSLVPSSITVTGVDLDGQWLRDATTAGGPGLRGKGSGSWPMLRPVAATSLKR